MCVSCVTLWSTYIFAGSVCLFLFPTDITFFIRNKIRCFENCKLQLYIHLHFSRQDGFPITKIALWNIEQRICETKWSTNVLDEWYKYYATDEIFEVYGQGPMS